MDSSGEGPTTARLSPVASTSSYFLQLDPTSGRYEIVDSSNRNNSMDLVGDETVYELQGLPDEDYFISGQFMDHSLPEMDSVGDISDLLDKPLSGFLQDDPSPHINSQGNSTFPNFNVNLASMSGYEEIRGSEAEQVQQAFDEAYGSGSLTDPVVLGGDEGNSMIFCVNASTASQDPTAQNMISNQVPISSSPPIVTISDVGEGSNVSLVQASYSHPSVHVQVVETDVKDSVNVIAASEAMEIGRTDVGMQNRTVVVEEVVVKEREVELESPNQNQTEDVSDCVIVHEDLVERKFDSGQRVEPVIVKREEIQFKEDSEEQSVHVEQSNEKIVEETSAQSTLSHVPLIDVQTEESEWVEPDMEMDFDIKIVSCYSQQEIDSKPQERELQTVEDNESEAQPTNKSDADEQQIDIKPKPEIIIKSEPKTETETISAEKVESKSDSEIENDDEIIGRVPHIPEWLSGAVDPNDELLVAFKSRPDPMMTAICVFCYLWFPEKEDLQEHIKAEHAKSSKFHRCKTCDARFPARILRLRHEKLHRYDLKRPWTMYVPSKSRPYEFLVKNHFTKRFRPAPLSDSYCSYLNDVFSLVEKLRYECHDCDHIFTDEESIREHYERSHALQSCRFCGEVPGNWTAAVQHEKDYHGHYEIEGNYVGGAWKLWGHWFCPESVEKEEILSNIAFFHSYRKRREDEPIPYAEEFIEVECKIETSYGNQSEGQTGDWTEDEFAMQFKQEVQDILNMPEDCQMDLDDLRFQSLPFKCNSCPKSYDNAHDLKRHTRCHSIEKMPLACQYCGKGFKTHSHKKEHERTHTQEKPYVCPICQRSFIQSSNLKKHIQTHKSLNTLQCDTCQKQFIKESSLLLHQRAHAQDRKFRCHICDRAYNYASLLKRHMRIHTGETPYSCEICGTRFHELVSLHYHRKKVHTGERPHSCDTCGRAFILSSDLKKHIQIHLKVVPEKVQKKPSKPNRSQSQSLENGEDTTSRTVEEVLATIPELKEANSAPEVEENNHRDDPVIEEIQLESDEEPSTTNKDIIETPEIPVDAKPPPALRVYQRKESKQLTPTKIQVPGPPVENLPALEVKLQNEVPIFIMEPPPPPPPPLANTMVADECDKDLLLSTDVDEMMIEESIVTVVLDQSGQEMSNDFESSGMIS